MRHFIKNHPFAAKIQLQPNPIFISTAFLDIMIRTSWLFLWGRMDSKDCFSLCFHFLNRQVDCARTRLLFAMALETFNRDQIFMLC